MKYPMLVVDTLEDGIHLKRELEREFSDFQFSLRGHRNNKFSIDALGNLHPMEYKKIYDFAQELFEAYNRE